MGEFNQLLSFLAANVGQSQGGDFFVRLCRAISTALATRGALLAQWSDAQPPEAIPVCCVWDQRPIPLEAFDLAFTPTAATPEIVCIRQSDATAEFPRDAVLRRYAAQSYLSVRAIRDDGTTICHVAIFDDRSRQFSPADIDILRLSATRAGTEIERLREENARRCAQAMIRQNERTFSMLLEYSPVATLVSTPEGHVQMVNRKFQRLFGYTIDDIPNLDALWPLVCPDPAHEASIRSQWYLSLLAAQSEGNPEPDPVEFDFTCRDGIVRHVQVNSIRTGDRQITSFLDLTERQHALRAAEQACAEAEKASRTKDHFLAALSHELRTPLTPVLLETHHLKQMTDLRPEVAEAIEAIHRGVSMQARLIDDLLDLSRISHGKLELHQEAVNLHHIIAAAIQICSADFSACQLRVVEELDARSTHIFADPSRMQQVFWNLFKNAVKFTPPGGQITIRSCNNGTPDDPHTAEAPEIVVEIRDTGLGMTSETIGGLFNAFSQGSREITRQFGGLGLGLSISKAIVERHLGSIGAHSDGPGQGSCFTVRLKTCEPPTSNASAEPDRDVLPTTPPAHILLVEDHEATGKVLKRLLEGAGHRVTWSRSIQQAHTLIRAQGDFDLMISDLGLPDGSGLELMPAFRERTGRPGIALSGYGMEQDARRSSEAGFAAHLVKPVDLNHLRQVIGRLTVQPAAELRQ